MQKVERAGIVSRFCIFYIFNWSEGELCLAVLSEKMHAYRGRQGRGPCAIQVADLGLAVEPQRLRLAEGEMPGLMAIRKRYAASRWPAPASWAACT